MTREIAGTIVLTSHPSGIVRVSTIPFPATSALTTSSHDARRSRMYVPALMLRSRPVTLAYTLNSFADPMTPAASSESAARRRLAPEGTVTRAFPDGPQPVRATRLRAMKAADRLASEARQGIMAGAPGTGGHVGARRLLPARRRRLSVLASSRPFPGSPAAPRPS